MTVTELMREPALPEETAAALAALELPPDLPDYEAFLRDPAVLSPWAGAERGLVILKAYLSWIPEMKRRYDALGIPETLFADNLRDLELWSEDYLRKYGIPGFAEWEWAANSLRLKVFRLGRLQFEPRALEADLVCAGERHPAGTPVLEIHIPAGEPLSPDTVAASLALAPEFFGTCFGRRFSLMHCHSWLLSPALKELLPPGSRILGFQALFTVYGGDGERQAEERVFGALRDEPAAYPEDTALRRSLRAALMAGKTVGMAMGIRKIT